ncbi:MAG: hypothetical protein FWD40_11560 [Treponema sp.]|nr:hypothetical protein [Treponema sp.]
MKRIVIFLLLCPLLLSACELFDGAADPYYLDKLYEEVAWANAPWVPLRIETGILGTASPMGPQPNLVKLGYSFKLIFQPSIEYPFIGWQAWIDDNIIAYWRPGDEYGNEKVRFTPTNSGGTEVEVFIYELPPEGKQLSVGPIGAEGDEIEVELYAGGLGNIYPAAIRGIKRGFPFTLNYQPMAQYPFEYWEARWTSGNMTRSLLWKAGMDYGDTEPEVIFRARDAFGHTAEITIMFEPDDGKIRIGPAGTDSRELEVSVDPGELGFAFISITDTAPAREGFPFNLSFQPSQSYPFRGWQIKYKDSDDKEHLLSNWLSMSGPAGAGASDRVLWDPQNIQGTDIRITIKFLPEDADYKKAIVISPLNADSPQLNVAVNAGEQEGIGGLGVIGHTISAASPARISFPFSVSFQPHSEYPFQGWQAIFKNGTRSVWMFGDGEREIYGVLWAPKNATGTEINITIEELPENILYSDAITIMPLGGDSLPANIILSVPDGWGAVSPAPGALTGRRQTFPFAVEFTPSASRAFVGWRAYTNYVSYVSPGLQITDTNVVRFTGIDGGKAQVMVNTGTQVTLVPWSEERPRVNRSNPSLIPAISAFPYDQTVTLWFSDTIDRTSVMLGNAGGDTISVSGYSNQGLAGKNQDGDISDYFSIVFFEDDTRIDLVVKNTDEYPSSDLQSLNINVVAGPGIRNKAGNDTQKKNAYSHQMASAQTVSYLTGITESQKIYEAFDIQASRVNGSDYFQNAGTQWNNPLIDRRFNTNTVFLRFNVSAPEGVSPVPDRFYIVEQKTGALNGEFEFSEFTGVRTVTTSGGFYNMQHTLQTSVPGGIIRLVVIPCHTTELPLVEGTTEFGLAVSAAVTTGRYVTVVRDAAAPVISGSVTNISGNTSVDEEEEDVYVFGQNPVMTVSLGRLNLLSDNGAAGGISAALAWNRPWTMDDRANLQWQVLVGTSTANATAKTGWLDVYKTDGDPNDSGGIELGSGTSPVPIDTVHTVWIKFRDRIGNESILYEAGKIKRIELIFDPVTNLSAEVNASGNQITVSWNTPSGMSGAYVYVNGVRQATVTSTGSSSYPFSVTPINANSVRSGQSVSGILNYDISVRSYNAAGDADERLVTIWNIPDMHVTEANANTVLLTNVNFKDALAAGCTNNFVLTENVTLSDWTPFSTFTGKFYGNGNTITINNFNTADNSPFGLFGIADGALIRDLRVEYADMTISSESEIKFGGIAGQADGNNIIRNVIVGRDKGKVTVTNTSPENNANSPTYAGMITGSMQPAASIENSYTSLELIVIASGISGIRAGGIAGYISSESVPAVKVMIDSVTMAGIVDARTDNSSNFNLIYLGGIAGESLGQGRIQTSEVSGTLTMTANSTNTSNGVEFSSGGIIGRMGDGHINNCHFTGKIDFGSYSVNRPSFVGGVVGRINGISSIVEVTSSTASGDLSFLNSGSGELSLGGVCGEAGDESSAIYIYFTDCEYRNGSIENGSLTKNKDTGNGMRVIGGFIGRIVKCVELIRCSSRAGIINHYSNDSMVYAGGFVGQIGERSVSTFISCYSTSPVDLTFDDLKTYTGDPNAIHVGGFVGYLYQNDPIKDEHNNDIVFPNNIKGCYAAGSVKVTVNGGEGRVRAGGFLGFSGLFNYLYDCYALGDIIIESKVATTIRAGGFSGEATNSSTKYSHCFSAGFVYGRTNSNTVALGGFKGFQYTNNGQNIYNSCVALGASVTAMSPASGVNRIFDGLAIRTEGDGEDTGNNNYAINSMRLEKGAFNGFDPVLQSVSDAGHNQRNGDAVSASTLRIQSFWNNTLGYSSDWWDFSTVASRGYPVLRGMSGQ